MIVLARRKSQKKSSKFSDLSKKIEEPEIKVEHEYYTSSATPNFQLFDEMELLEFKDRYVIRAINSPNQGFSASWLDGDIQPLSSDDVLEVGKTTKICGVVGTIQLVSGMYILVITSSKEAGKNHGFPIMLVESMKYLPCNRALEKLEAQEKKDEVYFRNLLRVVESTPGLYYSYETDITFAEKAKAVRRVDELPIWKQNVVDYTVELIQDVQSLAGS